jgi:toxin HigB-1
MAITSFKDKHVKELFDGQRGDKKWESFARVARRKLLLLDAATVLSDLKSPGNSLEALKDDRQGQHSIRINDQYRVCFIWVDGNVTQAEITDYH